MPEPTPDQADHGWENRRLILASLAPRTTTRPARRTTATDPDAPPPDDTDTPAGKRPGPLTRTLRASGRAAAAGATKFNDKVPPNRRAHTAVLTAAALVVLLLAVAGVRYLSTDVSPQAQKAAPTTPLTSAPTLPPLNRDTILSGIQASDICPRDANYSDANRAFDGDLNTAWECTRAKNQNGQTIQVNFGRQVSLTRIRATSGFDAITADGVDQWSKHRIVTKYEIYFPKELNRPPITLDTNGDRDWRPIDINPPAITSKLLIRIADTTQPPQSETTATETTTAPPTPDDVTTVAVSEIEFTGSDIRTTT